MSNKLTKTWNTNRNTPEIGMYDASDTNAMAKWLLGQIMPAPANVDLQSRLKPHINNISNIIYVLPLICFAVHCTPY